MLSSALDRREEKIIYIKFTPRVQHHKTTCHPPPPTFTNNATTMTSPPNPPILLLKTKSNPHDNYEEYFLQNPHIKYEPHFVPVLEHIYRNDNLQVVRDLFLSGSLGGGGGGRGGGDGDGTGKRKYGGLIFTSQRAVEGFARMLEEEVPCMYGIFTYIPLSPTP